VGFVVNCAIACGDVNIKIGFFVSSGGNIVRFII